MAEWGNTEASRLTVSHPQWEHAAADRRRFTFVCWSQLAVQPCISIAHSILETTTCMTPFAGLGRLCGSCCRTPALASQHAASRFTTCSPVISAFARELSIASMRGSTCCRPAKLDRLRGLQLHQQNQIYGCYFGGRDISPLDDALQKQTRLRRVLVDMWCCWAQSHPRAIHDLRECVKLSADWPSTADLFHVASGAHAAVLLPSILIWRALWCAPVPRLLECFTGQRRIPTLTESNLVPCVTLLQRGVLISAPLPLLARLARHLYTSQQLGCLRAFSISP
jgi:hypothetical protein